MAVRWMNRTHSLTKGLLTLYLVRIRIKSIDLLRWGYGVYEFRSIYLGDFQFFQVCVDVSYQEHEKSFCTSVWIGFGIFNP